MFRTRVRRNGQQTVLYRAWRNMKSRVRGSSSKSPWIYKGLPFAFPVFRCFRCYALAMGFSSERRSPERVKPNRGYVPGNVAFVAVRENHATSRGRTYGGHDSVRGPEPPYDDTVPF